MKFLFYNVKTTGLDPMRHGIHRICGEVVVDGISQESFDLPVQPNPSAEIDEAALSITGVSREEVLSYPPLSHVFSQFVGILNKYVDRFNPTDKFFLVGFNNKTFDDNFLREFFLQNNDRFFGSYFWSNSFDMMSVATPPLASVRHTMRDFRLPSVASACGVDVSAEEYKGDMGNVRLTKAVFDTLVNMK